MFIHERDEDDDMVRRILLIWAYFNFVLWTLETLLFLCQVTHSCAVHRSPFALLVYCTTNRTITSIQYCRIVQKNSCCIVVIISSMCVSSIIKGTTLHILRVKYKRNFVLVYVTFPSSSSSYPHLSSWWHMEARNKTLYILLLFWYMELWKCQNNHQTHSLTTQSSTKKYYSKLSTYSLYFMWEYHDHV